MSVQATWLGQAGFLLEGGGPNDVAQRVLIDPYLSDSLAEKYRGQRYPHVRLRPAPLQPDALPPVAAVLCSHRHTDHMDPGTLIPLFAGDAEAVLVAPAAEVAEAEARSRLPRERMRLLDAGENVTVGDCAVGAVPAAHEQLEFDDDGRSRFLGYIVTVGGVTMYHSGDCAPYPGQADLLRGRGIDVALLPVNGRDAERLGNGVPGNFTFEEAVELCAAAGVGRMVAHHWGMFSFNTVDPDSFPIAWASSRGVEVVIPEHALQFELRGSSE